MLRNFNKEAKDITKLLLASMQTTFISKQFSSTIMLSLVYLNLTERRIKKTNNIKERRDLINEFDKVKRAIEKGIALFQKNVSKQEAFQETHKECAVVS